MVKRFSKAFSQENFLRKIFIQSNYEKGKIEIKHEGESLIPLQASLTSQEHFLIRDDFVVYSEIQENETL